jgi:hypothetical protein
MRYGVLARKAEFQRNGVPGWITLGEVCKRLEEHPAWAYYLIKQGRLLIERDPEIGIYLIPDNNKILSQLKQLLRGERLSLAVKPRSS